jgi:hypothetical protein
MPESLLFIVLNDGRGLRMEDTKALRQRLDVVVGTLNERLSSDIVRHWFLRWAVWGKALAGGRSGAIPTRRHVIVQNVLEFPVISPPAGGVDQPAGDARDEKLVGDGQLNDRVERFFPRGEHRVQFLCLRDRAREPIEHKAAKHQHIDSGAYLARVTRTRSCTACCSPAGRELCPP